MSSTPFVASARAGPLLLALSLAVAAPAPARAHGVSKQVERRGEVWAVRARYEGGKPLAGATFQVLRPGKPEVVAREGKTPADGWVEFLPDVPGTWRVRIADRTGHGKVVAVEVKEVAPPAPPPAPVDRLVDPFVIRTGPLPEPVTITEERRVPPRPTSDGADDGPSARRVLLAGAAIVAAFVALRVLRRRRPGR